MAAAVVFDSHFFLLLFPPNAASLLLFCPCSVLPSRDSLLEDCCCGCTPSEEECACACVTSEHSAISCASERWTCASRTGNKAANTHMLTCSSYSSVPINALGSGGGRSLHGPFTAASAGLRVNEVDQRGAPAINTDQPNCKRWTKYGGD